jgi:murein L,D-transpeptidase YcbB/YkuD
LEKDSTFNLNRRILKGHRSIGSNDSVILATLINLIKKELPDFSIDTLNDSMTVAEQFISAYQYRMHMRMTGTADSTLLNRICLPASFFSNKLKANMERLRWMQQNEDSLYIIVDVPLMELFFRKDNYNMMHMRVVVGKPERQTPSLMANMANVVINPSWGVPPTILKKDVLPGITKSGRKYLDKKGLKVYDRQGKHIDEGTITAKNYKRYIYKQSPGDDNSLGYVKFNLPNPYDIYLHDTPHRDDFGKRFRALSSGCIRVQEPREMAVFILEQLEKKRYTFQTLDSMIEEHKTRWEILKTKIPVHIVYLTNFEDSTMKYPRFLNDVYKRDSCLLSLLK